MLTYQQIDQYREEGAVVVPGILDAATCKRMKDVLTMGVMLDDTTVANGAMYVIPVPHVI